MIAYLLILAVTVFRYKLQRRVEVTELMTTKRAPNFIRITCCLHAVVFVVIRAVRLVREGARACIYYITLFRIMIAVSNIKNALLFRIIHIRDLFTIGVKDSSIKPIRFLTHRKL